MFENRPYPHIFWYDCTTQKLTLASGNQKSDGPFFLVGGRKIHPTYFENPPLSLPKTSLSPISTYAFPSRKKFVSLIESAQKELSDESKVVLARSLVLRFAKKQSPFHFLSALLESAKTGILFAYISEPDKAFLGLTPEKLFIQEGRSLLTESLAGTLGANQPLKDFLANPKEQLEQDLVTRSIWESMLPYTERVSSKTGIKKLGYTTHRHTQLSFLLNRDLSPLELIKILHPTAALGGYPKKLAEELIARYEPFQRPYYGQPIGWVWNKQKAEIHVAIRSAQLDGHKLRAFAGAGILKNSNAARELSETDIKLSIWPCKK